LVVNESDASTVSLQETVEELRRFVAQTPLAAMARRDGDFAPLAALLSLS
jgi:hypothetical protein